MKKILSIFLILLIFLSGTVSVSAYSKVQYSDNELKVYSYLRNTCGLSKVVTCGIMANVNYECEFDYTMGNRSVGYGLFQMTGERYDAMVSKFGTGFDAQLKYFKYEIEGPKKKVFDSYVRYQTSTYDAAYNFARYYEVCSSATWNARGNKAQQYLSASDWFESRCGKTVITTTLKEKTTVKQTSKTTAVSKLSESANKTSKTTTQKETLQVETVKYIPSAEEKVNDFASTAIKSRALGIFIALFMNVVVTQLLSKEVTKDA